MTTTTCTMIEHSSVSGERVETLTDDQAVHRIVWDDLLHQVDDTRREWVGTREYPNAFGQVETVTYRLTVTDEAIELLDEAMES